MDTVINRHATRALQNNRYLNPGIRCRTEGRRVFIEGDVISYFEKQMAQESLRAIEGILEIINELRVLGRSIRIDG